ncbi:hypothetical protein BC829DRAFT_468019, partial [Chytridium lagenaria]
QEQGYVVFRKINFTVFLTQNIRQRGDPAFTKIVSSLQYRMLSDSNMALFNTRHISDPDFVVGPIITDVAGVGYFQPMVCAFNEDRAIATIVDIQLHDNDKRHELTDAWNMWTSSCMKISLMEMEFTKSYPAKEISISAFAEHKAFDDTGETLNNNDNIPTNKQERKRRKKASDEDLADDPLQFTNSIYADSVFEIVARVGILRVDLDNSSTAALVMSKAFGKRLRRQ